MNPNLSFAIFDEFTMLFCNTLFFSNVIREMKAPLDFSVRKSLVYRIEINNNIYENRFSTFIDGRTISRLGIGVFRKSSVFRLDSVGLAATMNFGSDPISDLLLNTLNDFEIIERAYYSI